MRHKSYITTMAALLFAAGVSLAAPANAAEDRTDPGQKARGAKAWAENCGRCHNIRAPKELTDEEWDVSVTHMRVRANLPGDVVEDIVAFLQSSN